MILLLDRPLEVAAFVADRIEQTINYSLPWLEKGAFQAVGVTRRGKLIGGFVFHDMYPNRSDVSLSAAGYGAFLCKEVLDFLKWNAFENLGCAHVTCRSSEENKRAINILLRAGFILEGRQHQAWDGEKDAILLGLNSNVLQK